MTKNEMISKVIEIARNEVGYLEKKNNSQLYDKTANAGSGNYTKYWKEIKPNYQGQPWCACFVTWCFVQAFGEDTAHKLLKHYPYVYCPTMANLFTLHANPLRGDIVIFKHGNEFTHTGIVTDVDGDYFATIEGNTSGASGIIANGGGVCAKHYYNSQLPGTKFVRPEYEQYSSAGTPVHFAQKYFDKLVSTGKISSPEVWSAFDSDTPKAQALALIDTITGGTWTSTETDASVHWVQPIVISLCGKGIITDKNTWLTYPDAYISKALTLALIDAATGGTVQKYQGRQCDHWARNCLDSLCDKAIITTPQAWDDDFEGTVRRGNFMALVCNAFKL